MRKLPTSDPASKFALRILSLGLSLLLAINIAFGATDGATILGHAQLAQAVYDATGNTTPEGWNRAGDPILGNTGFKAAVFERTKPDGRVERVLTFAGTDDLADWAVNIDQAILGPGDFLGIGPNTQYQQALNLATSEVLKASSDGNVDLSITGHSLGGSLAQYASMMTGTEAVVFNSAGVNTLFENIPFKDSAGNLIANIQMRGDLISQGLSPLGQYGKIYEINPVPGRVAPLLTDPSTSIADAIKKSIPFYNSASDLYSRYERHGQELMVGSLTHFGVVDQIYLAQQVELQGLSQARLDILASNTRQDDIARLDVFNANVLSQIDDLRRFQTGIGINTPAFVFSTPVSTGGLVDITVPASSSFIFRVFDSGSLEDGDIINVNVASSAGGKNFGNISLTFGGQVLTIQIKKGAVELRIVAQNTGSSPPNTGGVIILSPVLEGPSSQNFNLNTGESGTLRVLAK